MKEHLQNKLIHTIQRKSHKGEDTSPLWADRKKGFKHSSLVKGLGHALEGTPISSHPKHWTSVTLMKYRKKFYFFLLILPLNLFDLKVFKFLSRCACGRVSSPSPMEILTQKINIAFILVYKVTLPCLHLV